MEIKDLVLLMLMPIILISLIVYTNTPVITGAVITQQEKKESNSIGTYSIMPSFKTKIDYSLEEYNNLKEKLNKEIIDICKNRQDIENCIKDKRNKLDWNCAEREEIEVLSDFVDKFKDCLNLKEDNAVCRFSFEQRNLDKRTLEIKLTDWYSQIRAELIEENKVLAKEFINQKNLLFTDDYNKKDESGKTAEVIRIIIEYQDNKPFVKSAVKEKDEEIVLSDFLFYKSKHGIKFIDKAQESNFLAPTPANKIIDLPRTKGIKFCAKTGKQIYAYDSSDNGVKLRDIVYEFAITFSKSAPKPVENLETKDVLKAENSVILVWGKASEPDVVSYSTYYSTKDFIQDKIEDIKKDESIKKLSALTENSREIEDIDLTKCVNPAEPCKYAIYNQQLEKNKLYYWKSQNKFIYLITDVKDGTEYNFAVTAVNDEGDEINNDKTIEGNTYILTLNKNYAKFTSIDDLAS